MKVVRASESGIIDHVLFKLEGNNALNCTYGINFGLDGDVTKMENVECKNISGISGMMNIITNVNSILIFVDLFSDNDVFANTLVYKNNIEFLMPEQIVHCIGSTSMGNLHCKAFLGNHFYFGNG